VLGYLSRYSLSRYSLSRYTHRVAIANSRLIACDHNGVTLKWKVPP
jgi:hypothetical protein